MRILKRSILRDGSGSMTLFPEEPEDMWYAYNLIRPGDCLRASAVRRVTTESDTGSTTSERIHLILLVRVQGLNFDQQSAQLHISGRLLEQTKWTKVGQYHTMDLELNRKFTLEKDEGWDSVAQNLVKEACDPVKNADVWAVIMQEGLAHLAVLMGHRTVLRQKVELTVPKKRGTGRQEDHDKASFMGEQEGLEKFFQITMESLLRQLDLTENKPILLASPGFIAQGFLKYIFETATRTGNKQLLAQKSNFVVAHSASGYLHSLNQVLQTPEVVARLKDTRFARETKSMNDFMSLLFKDSGRAAYGARDVERAVENGAVGRGGGVLLISDSLFRSLDTSVRRKWVNVLDTVRGTEGGEVRVLSGTHESGKQLEGLGGVAAMLTFPLEYLDEDDDSGNVTTNGDANRPHN